MKHIVWFVITIVLVIAYQKTKMQFPKIQENPTPDSVSSSRSTLPLVEMIPQRKKEIFHSLSSHERQEFFSDIQHVFLDKARHVLDPDRLQADLIRLNERGEEGVQSIIDSLQKIPVTETEGRHRISYIDYLSYRMRWDPMVQEKAKSWILDGSENGAISSKSLSMILADKTELLSGLSRVNRQEAQEVLASLEPSILFEFGSQELMENGDKP